MYYNNSDPIGSSRSISNAASNSPEYPDPPKKQAGTFTRSTTRATQAGSNNREVTLGQTFYEKLLEHPEWSLSRCMEETYKAHNKNVPTDTAVNNMMRPRFADVAIGAPHDVKSQLLSAIRYSDGDLKKCTGMYGHLLRGPAGCGYREVMESLFNAGKRAVDNSNGTLGYRQLTLELLLQNLGAKDYAAKSILKNGETFRMRMDEWMRRVDAAEAGQMDGAHGIMSAEVTAPVVDLKDDEPLYVPTAKRRADDLDQQSSNILDEAFAFAFQGTSRTLDRSSRDGLGPSMPRPSEPPPLQFNHPVKQPSTRTSAAIGDGGNDSFGMYPAPFQYSSSTQSSAEQGMRLPLLQPADVGSNRVAQWVVSHFGASGPSNQPVQTPGNAEPAQVPAMLQQSTAASGASDAVGREAAIRSIQELLTSNLDLPGVTRPQGVLSDQATQGAIGVGPIMQQSLQMQPMQAVQVVQSSNLTAPFADAVDPDKEAAISRLMNEFMSGMPANGTQPIAGQIDQFGFQGGSTGTYGLAVDFGADGNADAMFFSQRNDADPELEALFQWHAEQQAPPF